MTTTDIKLDKNIQRELGIILHSKS